MKLIGMLDSPYVRRAAISLDCLGIPFEHQAVSVFSTVEQFRQINPVIKAPTLVFDDGELLMDSTLIIDYAEAVAAPKSLMPLDLTARREALRVIGLALAASEKTVHTIYERNLRPPEKQYGPWLERVRGQLLAACDGWERAVKPWPRLTLDRPLTQAEITAAVAWQFIQSLLAVEVTASNYPALMQLSSEAEARPEFLRYPPDGPGVQPAAQ